MQCVKLNPSWAKGYARKGAALHGARKFDESIAAYEEGIKLEDSPALRKGLKEVQDAKSTLTFFYVTLKLFNNASILFSQTPSRPVVQKALV